MNRADRIALLFSLLAILAGYLVADRIYERMAHIEDEMAFVWQAQVIARGHLSVPIPPGEDSFLVPFVVDYGSGQNGHRFGKYPLGWPALLAIGIRLGIRYLVNPLLGGLAVWLTYRLGKKILGETVGLLAAGLTLTSPFFLLNTGSLLSHPLGLVLSTSFALGWIDAFVPHAKRGDETLAKSSDEKPVAAGRQRLLPLWLPAVVAGASLGLLALTRPLTALAIAVPFGFHGLYLLVRGDWPTRRRLIAVGLIVLSLAALLFVWQYVLTGDPLRNPYTLWWEYDRVGFGPGHGVTPEGHNLEHARINTQYSLWVGYRDLFGWGAVSWLFLPFGLFAIRRNRSALLVSSVILSLIISYMAYWIGSWLFGPRYYYEGLYSLTLLSAAGIAWLAGWPTQPAQPFPDYSGWHRFQPLAVTALLSLLIASNLIFYTPMRLKMMFGLYGVQRSYLQPFMTPAAQELTPALIIVHPEKKWIEYGRFLDLEDPMLDSPFIFIISHGPEVDNEVITHFPNRSVYHYYTDTPYLFYPVPRP
jgi:hypothetical protein